MTRTTARIVPMRRSHVRACAEIAASSEPWKTLGETVDFARYLSLKQAHVCLMGGEPAGFVIFTPEPVFARGGYLRAIGISPHMRRRGIGRKLMSFAEDRTARRAQNFYLCVSSFNRQAQAFYRYLGYTRVGRIPGLISPKTAEYIYWKSLA
jgi:ribosomal protein S18 acetylase RimI-like enzyme